MAVRGYALVELLVAGALAILLTAVTCHVVMDARGAVDGTMERADLHQRARVALGIISARLLGAGSGPDRGAAAGGLIRWAPPILPGRPGATEFVSTAVTAIETLAYVPPATLAIDASAASGGLDFEYASGCPPPCGFFDRMAVALIDQRGDFDVFVLTAVEGTSAVVRRIAVGTAGSYSRGTLVLPVELHSLYLNALTRELRVFDGDRSDLPVVNGVVDLNFEYFGDPRPPVEPRPPAGDENCLFDSSGTRRPELQVLSLADGTLARLSATTLQDGPWCGFGAQPFDADLLRIRAVRISVRVQATDAGQRGADARWFRNPGTSVESSRLVRDVILRTTVAPPNLGGGR